MRRLLGVLREDAADGGRHRRRAEPGSARRPRSSRQPQPGLAQLAELIDAARDASVAGTRLIISGPVAPLDPGVELAAYRIVQEALTNARRHATGAAVDVELRYGADTLRLRVRDNGPGPVGGAVAGFTARQDDPGGGVTTPPRDGGHGLLGMRERAFSVGGALYAGAAPGGGFLVEAVLPADTRSRPPARGSLRLEGGPVSGPGDLRRGRGRPRGGAGRVRGAARHPAGLHRARHGGGRGGRGLRLRCAAARRRADGHQDAGHRRDRGDPAADGRARTRPRSSS